MRPRVSLALTLLLIVSPLVTAEDIRKEPMDIIILLDRSRSMGESGAFAEASQWLVGRVIGPLLIPEDYLCLLAFYGQVDRVWDAPIAQEAQKKEIIRKVATLKGDGQWTDIGTALDAIKSTLESRASLGRKTYILLLTDEQQEAPPQSLYFGKDSSFSHNYLSYTRKENHGTWNAITLGIGIDKKLNDSLKKISFITNELPGLDLGNESTTKAGSELGVDQAGRDKAPGALLSDSGFTLLISGLALAALVCLAFVIFLAVRKRKPKAGQAAPMSKAPDEGVPAQAKAQARVKARG